MSILYNGPQNGLHTLRSSVKELSDFSMKMQLPPKEEGKAIHPSPPPNRHTSKRTDGISRSDFAATRWGEERSQAGKIPQKKGHWGGHGGPPDRRKRL